MRKIIFVVLLTFAVLTLLYCALVVYTARQQIPQIVDTVLQRDSSYLELGDLSKEQRDILIAVVDPSFFDHAGISEEKGDSNQYVVTITRHLVDYYFKDRYVPILHDFNQNIIAYYAFDPMVNKNKQLHLFINQVYLGNTKKGTINGFAQGAKFYYRKAFKDLSTDEFWSLVAMIADPEKYNILSQSDANRKRVEELKQYWMVVPV